MRSGFRWRSHEVSGIEGLSDAVFRLRDYPARRIWFEQHKYFRRYGLQDGTTVTLNVILLFVVLFYAHRAGVRRPRVHQRGAGVKKLFPGGARGSVRVAVDP